MAACLKFISDGIIIVQLLHSHILQVFLHNDISMLCLLNMAEACSSHPTHCLDPYTVNGHATINGRKTASSVMF